MTHLSSVSGLFREGAFLPGPNCCEPLFLLLIDKLRGTQKWDQRSWCSSEQVETRRGKNTEKRGLWCVCVDRVGRQRLRAEPGGVLEQGRQRDSGQSGRDPESALHKNRM
jgi:hypothetical protein